MKNLFLLLFATILFASCGSDNPINNIIDDSDDDYDALNEYVYRIEATPTGTFQEFSFTSTAIVQSWTKPPTIKANHEWESSDAMSMNIVGQVAYSLSNSASFNEGEAPTKLSYTTSEIFSPNFAFMATHYSSPIPTAGILVKVYQNDVLILDKQYNFTENMTMVSIISDIDID